MSFYHQGSANLIDDAVRARGVDFFLAGVAGRGFTERYWDRIVRRLEPRTVIPTHFDGFFRPLGEPMGFTTNVNLARVPEEVARVSGDFAVAALRPPVGRPLAAPHCHALLAGDALRVLENESRLRRPRIGRLLGHWNRASLVWHIEHSRRGERFGLSWSRTGALVRGVMPWPRRPDRRSRRARQGSRPADRGHRLPRFAAHRSVHRENSGIRACRSRASWS